MKPCWATYLLWLVIAVFGAGAMLSACGHKGELYMPDQPHKHEHHKTQKQP